jgi:hypothetical protein
VIAVAAAGSDASGSVFRISSHRLRNTSYYRFRMCRFNSLFNATSSTWYRLVQPGGMYIAPSPASKS